MSAAVAVFQEIVKGTVIFKDTEKGCTISAIFSDMPPGDHGFHIHVAGDLRGTGCHGACDHYHVGPPTSHGDKPSSKGPRHTGDLGNVSMAQPKRRFFLENVKVADLYGRTLIVHADPDDLGLGPHDDSKTTGHSGKRIACAIIGRVSCPTSSQKRKTHKRITR